MTVMTRPTRFTCVIPLHLADLNVTIQKIFVTNFGDFLNKIPTKIIKSVEVSCRFVLKLHQILCMTMKTEEK